MRPFMPAKFSSWKEIESHFELTLSMEIREALRIYITNLPIILICALLSSGVGLYYVKTAPRLYTSTSRIFISTPSSSVDISALAEGSSFSQQRVKSYAQVISSPYTLGPVVKKLNLNISPEALAGEVSASAEQDTVLIDLSVTDADPVRAADLANAIASQFEITAQLLEVDSGGAGGTSSPVKVTQISQATPSSTPSSPSFNKDMAGSVAIGAGIGMLIAYWRYRLQNTVKNSSHLQGLPLLMAAGFDPLAWESPLISDIDKYSPRAESFRLLRTNILNASQTKLIRTIGVTSALSGEGKTTTAANLSISLAQLGKEVLLIEADLRRPRLSNYFNLDRESGTSEMLLTASVAPRYLSLTKFIKKTKIKGLSVITSGKIPDYPAELLGSEKFGPILRVLSEKFDFIVVDLPPSLPVADAAIVGGLLDGNLIVIKAGDTRIPQFKGVVNLLQSNHAPILGCCINMIPFDSRDAEDYGYQYGYTLKVGKRYLNRYRYNYLYGSPKGQALQGGYYPSDQYVESEEGKTNNFESESSSWKK